MKLFKEIAFATALSLLALVPTVQGQAHEITAGDLVIQHPWSRKSPKMANVSAGFMIITNKGTTDDKLIKATSDLSGVTQVHTMKMDGDVMKMEELKDGLVIPAGKSVELKPGSFHIMFMEVKSQPMEGQMFKGTLTFEKAGTVEVEYEVTNPDAGMN